ncbi:Xaa-Pro peptidase family protein [Brevibacillus choshinensis]|uniref:M24 family metallopeptidase n=1 Tax=Brevibacillus choshinensis TaxID=54911 RepID=UPI002E1FC8C9|nr:Xaa-Pro peptidase family protein [Brevibacillus choshinensis]
MNDRMKELYSFMERKCVDAMLITLPQHIYYLTGFFNEPHKRFMGLVLQKGEEPFLIVPLLDLEKAQKASRVTTIFACADTESPYDLLKEKLPVSISRLGVEEEHLHVARYRAVMAATGAEESIDAGEPLREMRMIKSTEEIGTMKRAIYLIEEVLAAALAHVKPGVTEIEIVAEMEYQMKKLGAERPAFDTIVLSGEKASQPHGIPGTRKIQNGELLLFDSGVLVDGYHSDISRTFGVGEINEMLVDMYETVLQANLASISAVKPGVTFATIDQAARENIAQKGYGKYFLNRVGHGLGMELHEYPSVHGNNHDIVREGMVFTIEPGIYIPQLGGVRIEDNVFVTREGAEVLTSYPKKLTIIGS